MGIEKADECDHLVKMIETFGWDGDRVHINYIKCDFCPKCGKKLDGVK